MRFIKSLKTLCHGKRGYSQQIRQDALGMDLSDFSNLLKTGQFESYRPFQAYQHVHLNCGSLWSDAKGLPNQLREWLTEHTFIDHGTIVTRQQSSDGTRKFLTKVAPLKVVECNSCPLDFDFILNIAVLIPEKDRGTLCVSSQVGCSLRCTFCHTGTQRFESNLTTGEIIRQFLAVPEGVRSLITNIVFMGQGEPLYNFRNVAKAVSILTDQKGGFGFGRGKITISTSGITPLIPKIASELGVNLAVSLHAPTDQLRSLIMPINNTYPLSELLLACEKFIANASCATRRVSFEYVMLKDINDQVLHAKQLALLIKDIPSHVNLIPFNAWPGASYQCTPMEQIERFKILLERKGIPCTIRRSRGSDILAACGQLKSSNALKEGGG